MTDPKEQYLYNALERFKEMITNKECSRTDIMYFYNLSKYELERRGADADRKRWLTKKEVSEKLGISTSTFDRMVLKKILPRGRKILHQTGLVWNGEEVGQLKSLMLLKANS